MSDPRLTPGRALAVLAAGALALAALSEGWATIVCLAVAGATGAGALAATGAGKGREARFVVGAGSAAWLGALLLLPFVPGPATALAAVGLGSWIAGVRLSLAAGPAETVAGRRARPLAGSLAVVGDETLRLGFSLTGAFRQQGSPQLRAGALLDAAERNRERGWLEDPSAAHPVPPALEKVESVAEVAAGMRCERLRFESEPEPLDPEVRVLFAGFAANRTAHATWWRHEDPRPTIVCIHGFGMGSPDRDARAFEIRALHREAGLDVVHYTLPLHGERALGRLSGRGWFDTHPLLVNTLLAQAVFDLRRLIGFVRSAGAPLVGVQGLSLGGATAALLASLDARLACAVLRVPAVQLSDALWSELSPAARSALEREGAGEETIALAYASHDPLRHRPRVARAARLIAAGSLDRLCPPTAVADLWEHWERPAIHWFPGGHIGFPGRAATEARILTHLSEHLDPARSEPVALSRFRTPLAAP